MFGRNRKKNPPEIVTRIEEKTKADSGPINTKKDGKKGLCTKVSANHQIQMEKI